VEASVDRLTPHTDSGKQSRTGRADNAARE
jgi:hypothetical protein